MRRESIKSRLAREKNNRKKKKVVAKLLMLTIILSAVVISVTAAASFAGPRIARVLSSFSSEYMLVNEVVVKGAGEFGEKDIRSYVEPIIKLKRSMLSVPLDNIAGWLATRPYIARGNVRREFPGRIVITVNEKRNVALLLKNGFFVVENSGAVVRRMMTGENLDLPVITLENGLDSTMEESGIRAAAFVVDSDSRTVPSLAISEVKVSKGGITLVSMDLKRRDGVAVPILLGGEQLDKKVEYLKKIWPDVTQKKDTIEHIDGRYRKGISVKLKHQEVADNGERKI